MYLHSQSPEVPESSKILMCFASNFTWSLLKKKKKKMLRTSNEELYKGRGTIDFINTVLTWVNVSHRVFLHQDAATVLDNVPIKDTL